MQQVVTRLLILLMDLKTILVLDREIHDDRTKNIYFSEYEIFPEEKEREKNRKLNFHLHLRD